MDENNVGGLRRRSRTSLLWRRKSAKKSTATLASSSTMDHAGDGSDGPHASQENLTAHSIIPDPLGELPAWFKRETEMAAANTSSFRIRYALHNPKGPRWYRNHHLLPPPSLNRPPSLFSASFPPMTASVHSIHDRSEDSTRLPGPSRTPSSTPLPTPSSSQVGIPDPSVKPRSRKTSQDNVDLLDVSDPWGTHWHHQSPYDAGSSNVSPVSADAPEGVARTRSRLSSTNTTQARRKTVTPSPLSQSTSALHLQALEPTLKRKPSKRRKPVLAALFGAHEKATPEGQATSPVEDSSSNLPKRLSVIPGGALHINFSASKRLSSFSPMSLSANGSTSAFSNHSSKWQSIFGRLVRRFSILRRPAQDPGTTIDESSEGTPGGTALPAVDEQPSLISQTQLSPEKSVKASAPSKRVPPPRMSLDVDSDGPPIDVERETNDRTSSILYDMPFSPLGTLMIANPDAPSSGGTTPIRMDNALLPEAPRPEPKHATQDVPAGHHLRPADAQQLPSSGRSSPIPGLLSPISVSVPAVTFSDVPQFTATAHSPAPPLSIPPLSPLSGLRISTSAPLQMSIPSHIIGDLSPPSPTKEAPRPIPPHLVVPAVDDSPLSNASVLANPPTPYNADEPPSELPLFEKVSTDRSGPSKLSQDVQSPKQVSPQEVDEQRVDGEVRSRSNSTASRKTETYKLVRTQSDKVSSSSEAAFQAEGEQWSVVNSVEAPRRRRANDRTEKTERIEKSSSRTLRDRDHDRDRGKARHRDRDREGGRERERDRNRDRERERERERGRGREEERERRRRQERAAQQGDEDRRRTASHARAKSPPVDKTDSGSLSGRLGRARSLDTPQRPTLVQPLIFTLQDEPPRHRKSDDRPRDSVYSNTARPGPSPIVTVARVDRMPSMSARPTSELTSAADMNALRAREALEMDRLRKGTSMVHGQPETGVIASSSNRESKAETARDAISVQTFAPGSNHTSYVVQPLQAHPIPASVFYANMPAAPPSIIYAATSPFGQPHPASSTTYHTPPNSFTFPSKAPSVDLPSRPNPLPAPPRESRYQPVHLSVLPDRSSGSASEYWGNHTHT